MLHLIAWSFLHDIIEPLVWPSCFIVDVFQSKVIAADYRLLNSAVQTWTNMSVWLELCNIRAALCWSEGEMISRGIHWNQGC